jgi:hypothetical protein
MPGLSPNKGPSLAKAQSLEPGDQFRTIREGLVEVICGYGACSHDDRPQSIHVSSSAWGTQFFIAMREDQEVLLG